MVDAVSTVSNVTSAALRQGSQAAVSVASSSLPRPDGGFVSSYIRVDNLQNVAILEYRTEKGEVVQQYPTQAQIDAFKRAESLEARKHQQISSAETPETPAAPAEGFTPVLA
jgi:hypothetical protein